MPARTRKIKRLRAQLWAEQQGACAYCARSVPLGAATFDHVNPRANGGRDTRDNGVMACSECNNRKGHSTALA